MKKLVCLLGLVFLFGLSAAAQDNPKVELFAGYSFVHTGPGVPYISAFDANGGVGSVAVNLIGWGGVGGSIVGEAGGVYVGTINGRIVNANAETYMIGPKVSFFRHSRFSPFVQTLVGFSRSDPAFNGATSNFDGAAFSPGFGLDWNATRHLGVRIGQVDYLLARFPSLANQVTWNDFRYSGGVTLRF
jgi:hypothetical protein